MGTTVLELTSRSKADAYVFHPAKGDDGRRGAGWAICTVNDATGELLVCSDWGNAAHRWSTDPKSLGHATLTDFIGTRADVDYLARKLTSPRSSSFSWDATVAAFKREIVADRRRLDITHDKARDAWDALEAMEHHGDGDQASVLFIEHLPDEVKDLFEEPWELMQTEPTREFRALVDFILPALVKACAAEVARRKERT